MEFVKNCPLKSTDTVNAPGLLTQKDFCHHLNNLIMGIASTYLESGDFPCIFNISPATETLDYD